MISQNPNINSPKTRTGWASYSFNGKEKNDEWNGTTGAFQDYGMRMFDNRVARFISVDPTTKNFPMLTPFQFASDSPIMGIDLDGLELVKVNNAPSTTGTALLKIYATKQGKEKLSQMTKGNFIFNGLWTFNINYTFWGSSEYDPKSNSIYYSDWNPTVDLVNPADYPDFSVLGHEIAHGYNEMTGLTPMDYMGGDITEDRIRYANEMSACNFSNYLLSVYDYSNLRGYYKDTQIPKTNPNPLNEKIRNFASNDFNSQYNIIGASYEKSINNEEYKKYYSIMWLDVDKNAQFKEFTSKKDLEDFVITNFSKKSEENE